VKEDVLLEAVKNAINSLEPTLKVEETGCYEVPELTSDYPPMVEAAAQMNKLAGAEITYKFGKATEVLDGSTISKWITMDDNYQVNFDPRY
jgi:hypothetical protein